MIIVRPKNYFIVAGHAEGYTQLNAFDNAIMKAGVGDTNLIRLSSILPPASIRIQPVELPYGALIPIAYAYKMSSELGEIIASAVAIAIPVDDSLPGLIMEHSNAVSAKSAEEKVREMARQGFLERKRELKEIISISTEHTVQTHGASFAGVVLWDDEIQ